MSRRCRIGTVISVPEVMLAELLGASLDVAWIDLEHGPLTVRDVPGLAIGLRAADCEAHVRVPACDSDAVGPAVDAGVDGIVVPGVEGPGQAAEAVARLRYPPGGIRGFGPRRAGRFGRDTLELAQPHLTVQIESPAGVEAAEAIAAVPGVDALAVGCADLSMALGATGRLDHAALADAVARVARAAGERGVEFALAGGGDLVALARLAPPDTALIVHSVDVRLYARAIDQANELVVGGLELDPVGRP